IVLPNATREEPRKRRREKLIDGRKSGLSVRSKQTFLIYQPHAPSSLARDPWKLARDNSCAFLHGNDSINRHIRQSVHLSAWPGDLQGINLWALSQAEMNSRI